MNGHQSMSADPSGLRFLADHMKETRRNAWNAIKDIRAVLWSSEVWVKHYTVMFNNGIKAGKTFDFKSFDSVSWSLPFLIDLVSIDDKTRKAPAHDLVIRTIYDVTYARYFYRLAIADPSTEGTIEHMAKQLKVFNDHEDTSFADIEFVLDAAIRVLELPSRVKKKPNGDGKKEE